MKKTKLLLVSPLPPPYGGIARWTEQILSYLNAKDIVEYIHLDIAVRWRSVHGGIFSRIFGGIIQLFSNYIKFIFNLIKGYNVVHLTSSGSFGLVRDLLFSITSRVFFVKFIIHIRFGRIPDIYNNKNFEYYLLNIIFLFSNRIICIDKATYNFLYNYSDSISKKIDLIPNCIDYDFSSDLNNNLSKKNVISFVGWVKKEKGVEELVDAFLSIKPEGWVLKLIGPIDQKFYNILQGKYSISDNPNIIFVGNLNNEQVLSEIRDSRVFVLPSYTEGFPNVVLEAMATKNAIIATKVGAIPEMLQDHAGILVDVANQKSLEIALKSLLNAPSLQYSLSQNAFDRCKNTYSIEIIVNQYLNIWKSQENK